MTRRSSIFRKLNQLVWSVAISAILFEVVARIYVVHVASDDQFRRFASLQQLQERAEQTQDGQGIIQPHRYAGYIPTPLYESGKNKHNSLGFRGEEIPDPKPEGEFRIVCLGGSTTYTTEVEDHAMAYPTLLEKALVGKGYNHVSVINGGAPGYSSYETLASFAFRVIDLDPDMIIVYQLLNDVKPRLVWPPAAYRGDNSGARLPPDPLFMPGVLEYSTFLRTLMVELGWIKSHGDFENVVFGGPPTYYGAQLRNQAMRGIYPAGIFEKVPAEKMLETNKPVFFQRNMESLISMAEARGMAVVLATFAYCPEKDAMFAMPAIEQDFERMNNLVRRIGYEYGVPVIDFAKSFPSDPQFFSDGAHLNAKGSLLKARQFADFLDERGLVPKG